MTLIELNDSDIAGLIANLDHADKPTLRAAVDALIPLAAQSSDVCSLLSQRLTQPGHKNYWPVAYVLGQLPSPSDAVVGVLLDGLDHREPDIRWAIALLLIRISKETCHVVSQLRDLCASGSANQRRMALYCIRDLALSDAASLTAMLNALSDSDPTVRVAAAICLKPRTDLADDGKSLLLKTYLEDTDVRVRNAAAIALASVESPSEKFVAALRRAVESEDQEVRKIAATALDLLEKRRPASTGAKRDG